MDTPNAAMQGDEHARCRHWYERLRNSLLRNEQALADLGEALGLDAGADDETLLERARLLQSLHGAASAPQDRRESGGRSTTRGESMDDGWKDGRRDYGDGWTGHHGGAAFVLAGPSGDSVTLDGTPADCDIMHAAIVAMRTRPDELRAFLRLGGEARGRTVRARGAAFVTDEGWSLYGKSGVNDADARVRAMANAMEFRGESRDLLFVVDLLLPEEPPTVTGRVEVGP